MGLVMAIGWLFYEALPARRPLPVDGPPLAVRTSDSQPDAVQVRKIAFGANAYTVVDIDLTRAALKLFWKTPDAHRYGSIRNLEAQVERAGQRIVFATNAGIFDPDFTPCGLHVEDGREYVPLNLGTGTGNFYLKPNGVFLIDAFGARIVDAREYGGTSRATCLAVQSGPLLVLNGTIHPAFTPESNNRYRRSAVGISSAQHVVFAISDNPVNFHAFANLFLKNLNCTSALYLDGVISRFYVPAENPEAPDSDFAGILAVTVPQRSGTSGR